MSRYSSMSEKWFRRWYRRALDFSKINCLILSGALSMTKEKIAAFDASFMTKSGKNTDGLGMFWSGCTGQSVAS
ncbi:MAG: hypothetical protein ACPGEF_03360 [Endozoicomonas sp.]